MQTIPAKDLVSSISSKLLAVYDPRESDNISREILRHFYGVDRLQVSMNESISLPKGEEEKVSQIIHRLLKEEPLQHILGSVEFYGLEFKVDQRALIPRPETEELVDWVIENHLERNLQLLDIGTGTGCIPISLAKKMNSVSVSAIDVSKDALQLAEENAFENKATIAFEQLDILKTELTGRYDIIISNPPYIPEADKAAMTANVLDYEPGLALFVADHDPLLFYNRIADLSMKSLNPQGTLYFEIHEDYGDEVVGLLKAKGYKDIELRQDLQGKDRMTKATKP